MPDAHANFAYSTVATAPSPAASGTSLVVAAGDGAKFPAVPFNVTIWPPILLPAPANAEIARVTARTTDTLTITRAQEGTSARTVLVGDQVAAAITAKTLTDIELSYGTSLPATPFDTQEAVLVDSITNPSYQWHFRYNAGSSSAYKWEFIGGAPASVIIDTVETITWAAGAYQDLATPGPYFTAPRSGEYDVSIGAFLQAGTINNWCSASAVIADNVTGTWFSTSIIQAFGSIYPQGGTGYISVFATGRGPIAAGHVFKTMYGISAQQSTSGGPQFGRRKLLVSPVRVS